jgi:hypothetical protein
MHQRRRTKTACLVSIRAEAIRLQKSLIVGSRETGYGVLQIVAAKGIPLALIMFCNFPDKRGCGSDTVAG